MLRSARPPVAEVTRIAGRSGTTLTEIDYRIRDPDSPTADTVAFFLADGTRSLAAFRRISTLVEGSAGRIGPGLLVNVPRTLVWDAAADLGTSQPTLRGRAMVMARNNGQLLDLHFVTVPAGVPNAGDPALPISSIPVQDAELLGLWFWLLASNDPAVSITNGEVRGVGGAFAGQLLASGTSTTAAGRAFLWQRLGVREATAAEVTRARTGTTPGVQQYEPLKRVGTNPIKVNEIGVDTGVTTGTWLVRLSGS